MNGGPMFPGVEAVVRVELARLAPDDLLVIRMPSATKKVNVDAVNAAISESKFHGRVLVLIADVEMAVLDADAAKRQVIQLPEDVRRLLGR